MIKRIAGTLQSSGATLHRYPFELAGAPFTKLRQIIHVEIHIIGHEEIELAIVVIIDEGRAGRPTRIADARFLSNVGEGAVAVVSEQMVWPQAGHIDVVKAIVIVVTNGDPHSPADVGETGLVCNISKSPVAVVVIESAAGLATRLHQVHRQRVNKKDIEVAVVVIIKERHTATHGFDDVLLLG